MHQSCFIVFNLLFIYAWIPAQGSTRLSALLDSSSSLCCWQRSLLQVQVPACAGGKPGSLAPGALSDMGEAAFCASTHKRWPQAALAGCPLSLPVQVPGQAQAQAQAQTQTGTGTNSFDPTRIPSIVHVQDALTVSPCRLLFSYIFTRPPGPFRVSSSFSFSRPLHLPSCWALPLL